MLRTRPLAAALLAAAVLAISPSVRAELAPTDGAVAGDAGAPDLAQPPHDLAHPQPVVPALEVGAAPEPKVVPVVASVQIGERKLCGLRVARAGLSPETRAQRATHVLEQVLEEGHGEEVRVVTEGGTAVVYVGTAPMLQLAPEDAAAAGDVSLGVQAEECAASVRQGLRTELRRRAIANLVFSFSLIVLSGLLAFLLLGAVSRAAQRITAVFEARETLPSLHVGSLELLTPAAVRVTVSTAIGIAKPVVQLTILAGWLLSSLSLLPATQALGTRLTGYVLVPITTLLARVGTALPLLVIVAIGAFALVMLLRFLRVFFDSVAQGGIVLGWLSPQRARPASVIAHVVAILGALLAAAPLLLGDATEWGALRIAGVMLTGAVVLSLIPWLANAAIGTASMIDGRLQAGTFVEIGAHSGKLLAVTLTELLVEDRSGAEVRIPYLVTLFRPLRVLGESLPSNYEVVVDARAPQGPIRKALADALRRQGRAAHVELTEIEGERAVYRVVGTAAPGEEDLASAIADALTRVGVSFGRIRKIDST